MKRIVLLFAVIATFAISASAQCDKKVLWSAAKADFVDETGAVQETKNVNVAIYTNKREIKITHDDDLTDSLVGTIKEFSCEWKQPFKNGKTVIKSDLHDKDGEYTNSTITLEATDAKISVTINMVAPDGRKMIIKIPIDSYTEEKK